MIYAVGDIHGHLAKLESLLQKLPLEPEDRLVFIGDYIDRGPDSCRVIDRLIALGNELPNTIFLRGNHEQMALNARELKADFMTTALWMGNGGAETMDSYPKADTGWIERIPERHWDFLESTALEYLEGRYRFVHAGVLPEGGSWPYPEEPRLWIREEFLNCMDDFGAVVVFGHTPQRSGTPLVQPNKIGIDTAAAFGGPLTAVALDPFGSAEPTFFQA